MLNHNIYDNNKVNARRSRRVAVADGVPVSGGRSSAGNRARFAAAADAVNAGGSASGTSASRTKSGGRASKRGGILFRISLALVSALILGSVIAYCVIANQFKDKFIPGTYVNGIEASNLTADEVKERIRAIVEDYSITLTTVGANNGETVASVIDGSSIGYTYTGGAEVDALMENQNRFAWASSVFGKTNEYTVSQKAEYDADMLSSAFSSLPAFQEGRQVQPSNAYLALTSENAVSIVPAVNGNAINSDAAYPLVVAAVDARESSVDLTDSSLYKTPDITEDNEALVASANKVNSYLDTVITLNLPNGSTTTFDRSNIVHAVVRGDDGLYTFSSDLLQSEATAFMADLAIDVDTATSYISFQSTLRGTVQIDTGDESGIAVNRSATVAKLVEAVNARATQTMDLEYSMYSDAAKGISDSYIELDIQNQHLFVYKNGTCVFDCDVVTGKPSTPTKTGISHVLDKIEYYEMAAFKPDGSKDYSTIARYWMGIADFPGQGFHDMPSRGDAFGGTIYKTAGSHGCVNLSSANAKKLWDTIEVGYQVISFD